MVYISHDFFVLSYIGILNGGIRFNFNAIFMTNLHRSTGKGHIFNYYLRFSNVWILCIINKL